MMDFTLTTYRCILEAFLESGYAFLTFGDYIENPHSGKVVIMRHDVDLKPRNSLAVAKIEYELGVKASYYFRAVPESWDDGIILEIARLGHEVGYHYESLTTCNGDVDAAYNDFVGNLEQLRRLVNVKTICMHGSPRSPFDSKDIWKSYSYKDLDVIGEPYFDLDFSKVFYLTDTGRCWDGFKVSVRDRIPVFQEEWQKVGMTYHASRDVVNAIGDGTFPNVVMVNTHPQRWTDDKAAWLMELLGQNAKNVVKICIVARGK